MSYPLKIALRYIFSKRSYNFITVITFISILGTAIGVAVLIAVMSIFNGFRELTEQQIVGFDPHVKISSEKQFSAAYIDSLRSLSNIKAIEPVEEVRAVAMHENNMQVIIINAFKSSDNLYLEPIREKLVVGRMDLESADGLPGIVLGAMIADRMRALPGDTITLLTPAMIERSIRTFSIPSGTRFKVTGLFQANMKDYDLKYGFISSENQSLINSTGSDGSQLYVRLDNTEKVENSLTSIGSMAQAGIKTETWKDINKELYDIMRFERMASFIILSIIILIAGFNVLASLSMTVAEKVKDIAVLKALGGNKASIKKIYTLEGLIIGLISTTAGTVIGLGFCYGQINYKWFRVDSARYIIDSIPLSINYFDVGIIVMFSILLSFMTTIYPARRAAGTNIISALRSE